MHEPVLQIEAAWGCRIGRNCQPEVTCRRHLGSYLLWNTAIDGRSTVSSSSVTLVSVFSLTGKVASSQESMPYWVLGSQHTTWSCPREMASEFWLSWASGLELILGARCQKIPAAVTMALGPTSKMADPSGMIFFFCKSFYWRIFHIPSNVCIYVLKLYNWVGFQYIQKVLWPPSLPILEHFTPKESCTLQWVPPHFPSNPHFPCQCQPLATDHLLPVYPGHCV